MALHYLFRILFITQSVCFLLLGEGHAHAQAAPQPEELSYPFEEPLDSEIESLRARIEQLELKLESVGVPGFNEIDQAGYNEYAPARPVQQLFSDRPGKNTHWHSTQTPPDWEQFPTINWSGFLQLDTGWFGQDEANKQAIGNIDASTGLRRVRLRVDGNVKEDTRYVIDFDFAAAGHPSFRNVMLQLKKLPTIQNLDFGYFKQPFGMDGLTSGRELLFLERQLPFALSPFRQVGIGSYGLNDSETIGWSTSTFRYPTDSYGVFQEGSGGYALAGRIYFIPVLDQQREVVMHFGMDYSFINPGDDTVRYSIQPGFFTRDPGTGDSEDPGNVPVFLDTGNIPTENFNLYNLEMALGYGPFHMESELRWSLVNQIGGPDLTFPGFYVQMGYILTGESRPYDPHHGTFRRVTPLRPFSLGTGGGACEVVFGYSLLNLNDQNIEGGKGQLFTTGINWYLHRFVKFQFEFSPFILERVDEGESHAYITSIRTQIEF